MLYPLNLFFTCWSMYSHWSKKKKIRLFLLRLEDRSCSQLVPWDLLSDSSSLTAGPLRSPEWQQQPHIWSREISWVTAAASQLVPWDLLSDSSSLTAGPLRSPEWQQQPHIWSREISWVTAAASQLVPWDLLSDSSSLTAGPLRFPEWQQQPHSWSLEISCVTEVLAFFFLTFLRSAAASSKNAYKWTMSSKQWFGSTLYITYADPNHWKNLLRRKLVVN